MTEVTETTLPPGDYAIVEMFGHTKLIGRMAETERFGAKMLALEPVFRGQLLSPVMIGGAAIYCLTPCSAEVALAKAPTREWSFPESVRAVIPAATLPVPEFAPRFLDDGIDQEPCPGDADDDVVF